MELGLYTFVPSAGAGSGPRLFQELLEQAHLADEVGLDVFGIGEHHRPDFLVSAPAVVLSAMAARTKRIRLTSAVSVLSSDDPVRVFQEFSTLDLLSGGRAEIMAGRGSFIESYPLFGYDLNDYDELFTEKLELLLKLRSSERISWRGKRRAPIQDRGVYPRPVQDPLPVWIAVGGTPQSVVRAGALGLPLALAIIGGEPARFAPLIDLYRAAGREAGHDPSVLKVGINSHGFIADTSDAAVAAALPPYLEVMGRIGKERGWPPPTAAQFDRERSPRGALLVDEPQLVIDRILAEYELFRNDRCLLQLGVGPADHGKMMRAIELFGTIVAPAVRKAVGVLTSSPGNHQ
jgi:probable LLM family oxidoreductase